MQLEFKGIVQINDFQNELLFKYQSPELQVNASISN